MKGLSWDHKQLMIVHQLPGRLRVRIPQLIDNVNHINWLRHQLLMLEGVEQTRFRPGASCAVIEYDHRLIQSHDILQYLATLNWQQATDSKYEVEYCGGDNLLNLIGLALSQLLPKRWAALPSFLLIAPSLAEGISAIKQRKMNVEVLDALALGLSFFRGDYRTTMLTQSLLTMGEYLEQQTSRHSDALLADLMRPKAHTVWIEQSGSSKEIVLSQLQKNDIMLLGPGDNIPADGIITQGTALINQSSMTGENLPVRRETGNWLYSGTQVQEGNIAVRAEKVGESSTMANIRRFITNSLSQRSEIQQVTQQMANRRVLITLSVGSLIFALTQDLNRLASVFMVDYSCALKLSTPITFKSIIYRAANNGLLLKGGRAIEQLAVIDTVVFDKTGTLTYGDMHVKEIISFAPETMLAERLLAVVASVEEHSNHPLAQAIVDAARQHELPHVNHGEVEYVIAHGLRCNLDKHLMVIGSRHFLSEHYHIDFTPYQEQIANLEQQGRHILFISLDDQLVGMIGLLDQLRPEVASVFNQLRQSGIKEIVLLTGDKQSKAQQLADELGIDQVYAEATPDSKVDTVSMLQQQGKKVLFVGDGVNDAAVLTHADVGLAMNQSTELAQQAADAVLMQDSLYGVVQARQLALEAMQLINSNIRLAEGINTVIMLSAALGWLQPTTTALLHNGTTLSVLIRSLLARNPPAKGKSNISSSPFIDAEKPRE